MKKTNLPLYENVEEIDDTYYFSLTFFLQQLLSSKNLWLNQFHTLYTFSVNHKISKSPISSI